MAAGNLSLEELLEEGYKRIARDGARLAGTNYPAYKGQTLSPMSDLTQRARGLQEKYSAKGAPYANKIRNVLNRNSGGISDNDIASQLAFIKQGQEGYNRRSALGKLQKQFGGNFNPQRFNQKTGRDIGRGLSELESNLRDIGNVGSNLDNSRNIQTAKTLQNLQALKQGQRENLIANLNQFGNQKHALNNFKNRVARNQFDQEVSAPYRKIDNLAMLLDSMKGEVLQGVNPDLEKSKFAQLQKAIGLYDAQRPPYGGELVADAPAELETSQSLLGRFNPNFRDSSYGARKAGAKNIAGRPNISSEVLGSLPAAMKGKLEQLEYAGNDRLKQDLRALAQKYTKLGQHNSPQHLKEAEARAREITRAMLEQRNKLSEGSFKEGLSTKHQADITNLGLLDTQGRQGQAEYSDAINRIRSLNELGATKWKNKQAENEEIYKNYQNQSNWELPRARRQGMEVGRNNAVNDIFSGLSGRNISLDNLAALNTNYSELEKERDRYRGQIDTEKARYQGELDSLQKIIDAQKRESALNQSRAAEAQRAEAEAKRQAEAQKRAAAERQRLEAIKQSAKPSTRFRGEEIQEATNRLKQALRSNYPALGLKYSNPAEMLHYLKGQGQPLPPEVANYDKILSEAKADWYPQYDNYFIKGYGGSY